MGDAREDQEAAAYAHGELQLVAEGAGCHGRFGNAGKKQVIVRHVPKSPA